MHSCQILTHDFLRKHFRAGEDGDERSQKRKTGHATTFHKKTRHHINKDQNAEDRKAKTDNAGHLQGQTLKPVIKVRAWIIRARSVWFDLPAARGWCGT